MWNDKKIIDSDLNGTQMEKDIKNMYFNWCADAKKYVLLENSIDSASPNNHVNSISESDWLWARATMQARGFSFRKNMNLMNLNKNEEKNSDTIADANHDNGKENMQEIVDIVSFIPFITLSNHDDDLGGRTTMGNGDTFSHTSYTFQTKKKIDKDKQIFNFYGELSFQQKFLSFGWVDRFPILSPEGFCITAFDIPLPLPTTSSISSNVLELEIKSNILLASEVASRKLMEKKGKVIGGKENGINSQQMISNDLSLKITLLKFDIRSMIQKVEEKGLKKIEIISLIHDILIEKKKNLIVGLNIKSIDRDANDDIHVDANHGISLSTDEAKNSQQNKNKNPIEMKKNTKLQQKTKSKENLKKIQNLADVSKEIESDGQYIRRTELEAIELLLTYLPSC